MGVRKDEDIVCSAMKVAGCIMHQHGVAPSNTLFKSMIIMEEFYLSKLEDLSGQRFGRLTVEEFAGFHMLPSGRRKSQWKCRCDCGNTIVVLSTNLKKGNSKSCGCYNMDQILSRTIIHGDKHARLYKIWCNMKSRCIDINCKSYKNYGARGITICNEWLSYIPFKEWAMSNGYSDNLSIDRIDVNGNYCPGNCRWATPKMQSNNRTNTLKYTIDGTEHSLAEWADIIGVKYHTLYARINILGMNPEDAIRFEK